MRLLALLLAITCALAPAQEPGGVSCRFLSFGNAAAPPPLLHVTAKGVEIACTVPVNNLSEPVRCSAPEQKITFLDAADRKPAAVARIPAQAKSVILVFVPAGKTEAPATTTSLPWRVFVVDDSPKNFPDGGAFVANFHQQDIRFVVGEHRILLRSGDAHGLARPAKRDDFNMAPVVIQFQQNEAWRTANESMLRFLPGMRYLILCYVDPASARPRVFTCPDIKPDPVAPRPPGG